eukprot:jgi/Mesen1/11027/ME000098S10425
MPLLEDLWLLVADRSDWNDPSRCGACHRQRDLFAFTPALRSLELLLENTPLWPELGSHLTALTSLGLYFDGQEGGNVCDVSRLPALRVLRIDCCRQLDAMEGMYALGPATAVSVQCECAYSRLETFADYAGRFPPCPHIPSAMARQLFRDRRAPQPSCGGVAVEGVGGKAGGAAPATAAGGRSHAPRGLAVNLPPASSAAAPGAWSGVLSLACPLSNVRIQTPVKGESCRHHQCFDFDSFVDINQMVPLWRCPCCGDLLSPGDLRLDNSFLAVLEQARGDPGVTKVRMKPSGEWEPVVEEVAGGVPAGPSAGAAMPVRAAWELPAVIELESGEDGKEEQVGGGQDGGRGGAGQAGQQSLPGELTGGMQQDSPAVSDVELSRLELEASMADRAFPPFYPSAPAAGAGGRSEAPHGPLLRLPLTAPTAAAGAEVAAAASFRIAQGAPAAAAPASAPAAAASTMQHVTSVRAAAEVDPSGVPSAAYAASQRWQAFLNKLVVAASKGQAAASVFGGMRPPLAQQQQSTYVPPVVQPARQESTPMGPSLSRDGASGGSSLKRKRPLQQAQQQLGLQQQQHACMVTPVSGAPPLYFFPGVEQEYQQHHQQLQQRSQTAGAPSGPWAGGQGVAMLLAGRLAGICGSSACRGPAGHGTVSLHQALHTAGGSRDRTSSSGSPQQHTTGGFDYVRCHQPAAAGKAALVEGLNEGASPSWGMQSAQQQQQQLSPVVRHLHTAAGQVHSSDLQLQRNTQAGGVPPIAPAGAFQHLSRMLQVSLPCHATSYAARSFNVPIILQSLMEHRAAALPLLPT